MNDNDKKRVTTAYVRLTQLDTYIDNLKKSTPRAKSYLKKYAKDRSTQLEYKAEVNTKVLPQLDMMLKVLPKAEKSLNKLLAAIKPANLEKYETTKAFQLYVVQQRFMKPFTDLRDAILKYRTSDISSVFFYGQMDTHVKAMRLYAGHYTKCLLKMQADYRKLTS